MVCNPRGTHNGPARGRVNVRSIALTLAVGLGLLLDGQTAARCEEIKSTPEFRLLCNGFHQDIELRNSTLEEIVDERNADQIGREAESAALRVFLDDVLSGRYSAEEINKLWNTYPADMYVAGREGGIALLKAVRSRLDQPPFQAAR